MYHVWGRHLVQYNFWAPWAEMSAPEVLTVLLRTRSSLLRMPVAQAPSAASEDALIALNAGADGADGAESDAVLTGGSRGEGDAAEPIGGGLQNWGTRPLLGGSPATCIGQIIRV